MLTMTAMPLGCAIDATDDAEQPSSTGSIHLALTGTSASGTTYRLSSALFDVIGPTARTLSGDGDAPVLTDVLPVGTYEIRLQPGWILERWGGSGYQPVQATLASPNPQHFVIADGAISTVAFQFQAEGDVVDVGSGTLEVVIGVSDPVTPAENTTAACSNGVDDDADGVVDCADPGCQSLPHCSPPGALIDDFEDGDLMAQHSPFPGPWAPFSDGSVPVDLLPVPGFNSGAALGVFTPEPPMMFGAGVTLPFEGAPVPFFMFQGIRFKVRSHLPTPLRFEAATLLTMPEGGFCADQCFDAHGADLFVDPTWITVELRWVDLAQQGWGAPAPFDPGLVMSLAWRASQGQPLRLELDDVELF